MKKQNRPFVDRIGQAISTTKEDAGTNSLLLRIILLESVHIKGVAFLFAVVVAFGSAVIGGWLLWKDMKHYASFALTFAVLVMYVLWCSLH